MMSEYLPVLTRRSEKWSKLLKKNPKVEKNLKGGLRTPPLWALLYYTYAQTCTFSLIIESLLVHYWQWRGMWGKVSPVNTVLWSGWLPAEPSSSCRWTVVITTLSWRFTMTPRWRRQYKLVSLICYIAVISQDSWSFYLKSALTRSCHLPDLHRTFPDNIQFHNSSQQCLLKALYNVLLAYGHHNKDVGYCQVQY